MSHFGALYERELADGRVLVVYPQIFTTRLCIGPSDSETYDDAYCYHTATDAIAAAGLWDGSGDAPLGWHRHIGSGRRRPDGDPEREYVMR